MGDEHDVAELLDEILNRPEPEPDRDDAEKEKAAARDTAAFMQELARIQKFVEEVNKTQEEFKKLSTKFDLFGNALTAEQEWLDTETNDDWEIELLVENYEVKTMRLPRDRKGKTPIDVGIVVQDGLTRVRLSMGEDGTPGRKNSDLSVEETENLITMLAYNLELAKGNIKEEE